MAVGLESMANVSQLSTTRIGLLKCVVGAQTDGLSSVRAQSPVRLCYTPNLGWLNSVLYHLTCLYYSIFWLTTFKTGVFILFYLNLLGSSFSLIT